MLDLVTVALILVLVGAINWGVVALTDNQTDLVRFIGNPMIEKFVKLAVGAAGAFLAYNTFVNAAPRAPVRPVFAPSI
jgi:uncharacterized membrane protein YuzA (DUF378 family)